MLEIIELYGYTPVCIEQGGENIKECKFPEKPCFIFGNEGDGIPDEILNSCRYKIEIPQFGVLRSLNVSTAAGIVMYEYTRNMTCIV